MEIEKAFDKHSIPCFIINVSVFFVTNYPKK